MAMTCQDWCITAIEALNIYPSDTPIASRRRGLQPPLAVVEIPTTTPLPSPVSAYSRRN